MEEKVKQTVQMLSKMFESQKDAIEVINTVILPMRGEIVEGKFWDAVRTGLEAEYDSVLGKTEKVVPEVKKEIIHPMAGFQVNVLENTLMTKGKGIMMLHPEDYKSYTKNLIGK